jgi:hypothetical protein
LELSNVVVLIASLKCANCFFVIKQYNICM